MPPLRLGCVYRAVRVGPRWVTPSRPADHDPGGWTRRPDRRGVALQDRAVDALGDARSRGADLCMQQRRPAVRHIAIRVSHPYMRGLVLWSRSGPSHGAAEPARQQLSSTVTSRRAEPRAARSARVHRLGKRASATVALHRTRAQLRGLPPPCPCCCPHPISATWWSAIGRAALAQDLARADLIGAPDRQRSRVPSPRGSAARSAHRRSSAPCQHLHEYRRIPRRDQQMFSRQRT